MPDTLAQVHELSDKMLKLRRELRAAREHQERKHEDWNDNYELYRNKVRTNRLTQRQAVNIPLMKETIKTALSKIDDPPKVDWQEKSGDEMKEIIFQEMWDRQSRHKKFEWIDVIDKKNVLMYGVSTKKLNLHDKWGVDVDVLDVFDVVYDPLMDPTDIDTARFIVHQNIFRPLRDVLADERYDQKSRDDLKVWSMSTEGMVQADKNRKEWEKKLERIKAMGVSSSEFPYFAAGDVLVHIVEHHTKLWNPKTEEFEKHVVVYADEWSELMDEKLIDLIGIDEYPFVFWAEDPEPNDIYSDAIADLVRTPNKVLNVWFSQQVENRTLQNFQMHWYDATIEGYTPQTYEPGPGRMLPAPGNPRDTIQPVEVNGLDESFTAIDFLTKVVERGSGTVAIDKGVQESGTQTLGEVEILVGKAMERSVGMQKFYRAAWEELADKWARMMHSNPPKSITLYKSGRSGKLYEKKIFPKDWKSEAGYIATASSSSEQEANQVSTIQKFNFVMQQFPENSALARIAQARLLEILDFSPAELKEVVDEQKRMQEIQEEQRAMEMAKQAQPTEQPQQPQAQQQAQPQGQPQAQPDDAELSSLLNELASL